jgi:hypothetical protein
MVHTPAEKIFMWLARAAEYRASAVTAKNPKTRATYLQLAASYEELAKNEPLDGTDSYDPLAKSAMAKVKPGDGTDPEA